MHYPSAPRFAWFESLTTNGLPPGVTTNGLPPGVTTNGLPPGVTTNGVGALVTTNGLPPGVTTNGLPPGVTTNGVGALVTTNGLPPGVTTNGVGAWGHQERGGFRCSGHVAFPGAICRTVRLRRFGGRVWEAWGRRIGLRGRGRWPRGGRLPGDAQRRERLFRRGTAPGICERP